MKGFIEEFYFGNLEPQARSFTQNTEVASQMEILAENETFLTKNLADEEKIRFLEYVNAWSAVNADSSLDSFINGFRCGARFAYDAFTSTDAPYQNISDK